MCVWLRLMANHAQRASTEGRAQCGTLQTGAISKPYTGLDAMLCIAL